MSEQNHKPAPDKKQTVSPEREAAIAQFWNTYITIIHTKGMKEPFDRWFVIRARHYIEAFPNTRLALHTGDEMSGYLNVLGRNGAWQGVAVPASAGCCYRITVARDGAFALGGFV